MSEYVKTKEFKDCYELYILKAEHPSLMGLFPNGYIQAVCDPRSELAVVVAALSLEGDQYAEEDICSFNFIGDTSQLVNEVENENDVVLVTKRTIKGESLEERALNLIGELVSYRAKQKAQQRLSDRLRSMRQGSSAQKTSLSVIS